MRRLVGVLLFSLAASFGQQSTLRAAYPAYVFIALNTGSVNFDFTREKSTLTRPGHLSRLAPAAYPTYAMPAASAEGWAACLGLGTAPSGSYQATPRPPTGAFPRCKFAPSEAQKNGAFTVDYRKTGDPGCDGPLYSDGDLLILSNTRWRVQARIVGTRPPDGVTLHVLPLTYKDPTTLCAKKPVPDRRVRGYDKALRQRRRKLSDDPSRRRSLAYYSQYQGVFALPLLYYLELDLGRLDPGLAGQTTTVEVEYVVRAR